MSVTLFSKGWVPIFYQLSIRVGLFSELSELTWAYLMIRQNLTGQDLLFVKQSYNVVLAELTGFWAAVSIHNCKHARRNLAFESFVCCKLHAETKVSNSFTLQWWFWPCPVRRFRTGPAFKFEVVLTLSSWVRRYYVFLMQAPKFCPGTVWSGS